MNYETIGLPECAPTRQAVVDTIRQMSQAPLKPGETRRDRSRECSRRVLEESTLKPSSCGMHFLFDDLVACNRCPFETELS